MQSGGATSDPSVPTLAFLSPEPSQVVWPTLTQVFLGPSDSGREAGFGRLTG